MTNNLYEPSDDSCVLTHREIQGELLKMLLEFDKVCQKNGLSYSLCGGTLLGAIRHKGFIPWDDDVDVCMPRPEYERLVSNWSSIGSTTNFELEGYFGLALGISPYAKFVNEDIRVRESIGAEASHLWIDVFPMDALPDDEEENERLYKRMSNARMPLAMQHATVESGKTAFRRIVKAAVKPLLEVSHADLRAAKHMGEMASERSWGSTAHVGGLIWGLYGPRERMPLSGLESYVDVEFEGERFKAMSCWEEYLTGLYGDYMQLPPEDKRVSHGIVAWRADGGEAR